jgi:hypothetical protein
VGFFGASASGLGGALGVVAFAAALLEVAGFADALELGGLVVVGLGFDVVAVGGGPHCAEDAEGVAGEDLGADACPVAGEACAPVGSLPAAAHGRLLPQSSRSLV